VQPVDEFGGRGAYPPHSYPKLKELPKTKIVEIESNLKELER
jgi:hypothetical protein